MTRAVLALCAVLAGCATVGRSVNDPGKAASEAHKASVAACRVYREAVKLGAPARAEADAACAAAEGVCPEGPAGADGP